MGLMKRPDGQVWWEDEKGSWLLCIVKILLFAAMWWAADYYWLDFERWLGQCYPWIGTPAHMVTLALMLSILILLFIMSLYGWNVLDNIKTCNDKEKLMVYAKRTSEDIGSLFAKANPLAVLYLWLKAVRWILFAAVGHVGTVFGLQWSTINSDS